MCQALDKQSALTSQCLEDRSLAQPLTEVKPGHRFSKGQVADPYEYCSDH